MSYYLIPESYTSPPVSVTKNGKRRDFPSYTYSWSICRADGSLVYRTAEEGYARSILTNLNLGVVKEAA